ncbi:MAG TPA: AraC family transcriptional regulator [Longimicrobiales bacterium]|nr:AraC family transcriptional regulator [Longimicrobiales bacterium]
MSHRTPPLSLLTYPYTRLHPLTAGRGELRERTRHPGSALVWFMGSGNLDLTAEVAAGRPGGVSLLVVLPPGERVAEDPNVLGAVQQCRPHGILPYHPNPLPHELAQVLRRPPVDLGGDVIDYLAWRGLLVDRDTGHVIRRVIDLSASLRSVSAVSRSMYLSRRSLGRRLMSRGLPVASHWLQVGRLLRVAVKLQNTDATVASVAFDLGYPDGFSVSNQMERLIGYRPSEVRSHLGWEWVLEAWLKREAALGRLTPSLGRLLTGGREDPPGTAAPPRRRRRSGRAEQRPEEAGS